MSAYAPTKTYSRAVSANLEFQRQLGVKQNSLESRKRHARCDLNTQIITLRETLFNIRARTPTIVDDEQESFFSAAQEPSPRRTSLDGRGSPRHPPSALGSGRGSYRSRGGSTSTPVGGPAISTSPTGETLVSSQNGLVATGARSFGASRRRRVAAPRRVLQVSVGVRDSAVARPESVLTPRTRQKINVKFAPARKQNNSEGTNNHLKTNSNSIGQIENSVAQRETMVTGPTTHGQVRRVVFSAHIRKKKHPMTGTDNSQDVSTECESENESTCSSLKPNVRPATAADTLHDNGGVNCSNDQNNIGFENHTFPRTKSRASTIITAAGNNEPIKMTGHLSINPGNHPSVKTHSTEDKVKSADGRNLTDLRPTTVSSARPKAFFLVRNPFFKLDPSTEKRIEQVESIRNSLCDIYHKRVEKRLSNNGDAEELGKQESDGCKGVIVKNSNREGQQTPKPAGDKKAGTINNTTTEAVSSNPNSSNSPSVKADSSVSKSNVTVKVKMSMARRSSRYSVHQAQRGPLSIPGVSSNQLRDLEKFHHHMNRKSSVVRNNNISS